MAKSARENDQVFIDFVRNGEIQSILDVGPGMGTYSTILKKQSDLSQVKMDAVEVWEPYVKQFHLKNIYNHVSICDIIDWRDFNYDLIVFGDVLEHMTQKESINVWELASREAKYGMISVPIIHYPQGHENGNPFEEHIQEDLTPEHIRETYGPFIVDEVFKITGTFIKEFK